MKTTPTDIVAGPDGNLWFSEWGFSAGVDGVGKMSTAGVLLNEYESGISPSQIPAIANGPDGKLWIAESNLGQVAKITTAGAATEYRLQNPLPPNPQDSAVPEDLVRGPDANMWTTGSFAPTLFQVTRFGRRRGARHVARDRIAAAARDVERDHQRPRREPLVHRHGDELDRAPDDGRRDHRVPDPDARLRPVRDHRRSRRQRLVHGAQRRQDRPRHAGRGS